MSDQSRYALGEKEVFSKDGYTITWKVIHDDDEDQIRLWRNGEPQPFKTFNDVDIAKEALGELLKQRTA